MLVTKFTKDFYALFLTDLQVSNLTNQLVKQRTGRIRDKMRHGDGRENRDTLGVDEWTYYGKVITQRFGWEHKSVGVYKGEVTAKTTQDILETETGFIYKHCVFISELRHYVNSRYTDFMIEVLGKDAVPDIRALEEEARHFYPMLTKEKDDMETLSFKDLTCIHMPAGYASADMITAYKAVVSLNSKLSNNLQYIYNFKPLQHKDKDFKAVIIQKPPQYEENNPIRVDKILYGKAVEQSNDAIKTKNSLDDWFGDRDYKPLDLNEEGYFPVQRYYIVTDTDALKNVYYVLEGEEFGGSYTAFTTGDGFILKLVVACETRRQLNKVESRLRELAHRMSLGNMVNKITDTTKKIPQFTKLEIDVHELVKNII